MGKVYEYKIISMQRDNAGIVKTVVFDIAVSDDADNFTHSFVTGLPAPTNELIPYENLTHETVVAWVKELVGAQSEESADAEFEAYKIRKNEILQDGTPWQ